MRTIMSYTFKDRHERMRELSDKDVDRYFELLDEAVAESEEIALALMHHAARHGCVLLKKSGSNGQFWFLHRSAKYGTLQLTTWDELGPVSDVRVSEPSDFSHIMNGSVTAKVK